MRPAPVSPLPGNLKRPCEAAPALDWLTPEMDCNMLIAFNRHYDPRGTGIRVTGVPRR